ncbi:hypothetical protein [Streptomyces hirsutus]
MSYEIDFLLVGEEYKGGDVITLWFGTQRGSRRPQAVAGGA